VTAAAASSGNAARLAARPVGGGGTPAADWTAWDRAFPELSLHDCPGLLLVGPHPDDETLGFGATAATLHSRGVDVRVVSVSDGGGAYLNLSPLERTWLERARRSELLRATSYLGLTRPISLGLPDGTLCDHETGLADTLSALLSELRPGAWCAATWRGDGHPDHEAVGRAAAVAAQRAGAKLLEYPVWMWHWARPDDTAVPWHRMARLAPDRAAVARKQVAAQEFQSQLTGYDPDTDPVLPPFALRRLLAVGEVAFTD
jgi:LmbE family N-acetylglucosaminyl deacetylase